MNAYESGTQKIIPAVLIYAFYKNQILMIHRNLNPNDFHLGKYNGLGGKTELGETPRMTCAREFFEESGIQIDKSRFNVAGHLNFPNFKPHKKEDWSVSVFTVKLSNQEYDVSLQKKAALNEGTLRWIDIDTVLDLPLWEGDQKFIPLVIQGRPFQGTLCYHNGALDKIDLQAWN